MGKRLLLSGVIWLLGDPHRDCNPRQEKGIRALSCKTCATLYVYDCYYASAYLCFIDASTFVGPTNPGLTRAELQRTLVQESTGLLSTVARGSAVLPIVTTVVARLEDSG
jgi:hypothetical protein